MSGLTHGMSAGENAAEESDHSYCEIDRTICLEQRPVSLDMSFSVCLMHASSTGHFTQDP